MISFREKCSRDDWTVKEGAVALELAVTVASFRRNGGKRDSKQPERHRGQSYDSTNLYHWH
ncbi:hypothetical protein V1478_013018 [Vespula squamosa]|uniref:Uncharacterized protein n=1 Tax=Vespula squamosa TaxID=30214 RepID=A0ABD2A9L4_VESSQ